MLERGGEGGGFHPGNGQRRIAPHCLACALPLRGGGWEEGEKDFGCRGKWRGDEKKKKNESLKGLMQEANLTRVAKG